jgi:hypothetical protein
MRSKGYKLKDGCAFNPMAFEMKIADTLPTVASCWEGRTESLLPKALRKE